MEAYVQGISTRSVDALVEAMGIDSGISKSEVSRICAGLDETVGAFRTRVLDHVEFRRWNTDPSQPQSSSRPSRWTERAVLLA